MLHKIRSKAIVWRIMATACLASSNWTFHQTFCKKPNSFSVVLSQGFEIAIPGTVHHKWLTPPKSKHAFFVSFRNGFNLSNITNASNCSGPVIKCLRPLLIDLRQYLSIPHWHLLGQFIVNSPGLFPHVQPLLELLSWHRGLFLLAYVVILPPREPVLYIKRALLS